MAAKDSPRRRAGGQGDAHGGGIGTSITAAGDGSR